MAPAIIHHTDTGMMAPAMILERAGVNVAPAILDETARQAISS
jgi:hypothetical protein